VTDYEAAFRNLSDKWHESVKHYEDRIEKLEAALREIEYLDRPQVRGLPRRIEIAGIARKALEGKDGETV